MKINYYHISVRILIFSCVVVFPPLDAQSWRHLKEKSSNKKIVIPNNTPGKAGTLKTVVSMNSTSHITNFSQALITTQTPSSVITQPKTSAKQISMKSSLPANSTTQKPAAPLVPQTQLTSATEKSSVRPPPKTRKTLKTTIATTEISQVTSSTLYSLFQSATTPTVLIRTSVIPTATLTTISEKVDSPVKMLTTATPIIVIPSPAVPRKKNSTSTYRTSLITSPITEMHLIASTSIPATNIRPLTVSPTSTSSATNLTTTQNSQFKNTTPPLHINYLQSYTSIPPNSTQSSAPMTPGNINYLQYTTEQPVANFLSTTPRGTKPHKKFQNSAGSVQSSLAPGHEKTISTQHVGSVPFIKSNKTAISESTTPSYGKEVGPPPPTKEMVDSENTSKRVPLPLKHKIVSGNSRLLGNNHTETYNILVRLVESKGNTQRPSKYHHEDDPTTHSPTLPLKRRMQFPNKL